MSTVLVEKKDMKEVVELLQRGEVVAFPTETVFGLGVKFGDLAYLEKIYELKKRDHSKAVTLMVADKNDIEKYAYVSTDARKVIDAFMPGMMTLILKKKENVDDRYTAGLETIGIRIPDDPFVLQLLKEVGPMLVTSANRSGEKTGTTFEEVMEQLDGRIDGIVRGTCGCLSASTIIDVSQEEVRLLREGPICREAIDKVLVKA